MKWFFTFSIALLLSQNSSLIAQTFSSGEKQVSLIELYTSEGCSSCPPAEAWLNKLRSQAGLWEHFVPIAFHVTYWDYIGWKDTAAQDSFTKRQRSYATSWGSTSVYTPCFVLNGKEWRPGENKLALPPAPTVGNLTVSLIDGMATAQFQPLVATETSYEIHFAIVGARIENKIYAGENAGRTLRHDFTALSWAQTLLKKGADGKFSAEFSLKNQKSAPEMGLVAWVTHSGNLIPIQAAGGWLQ